MIKKLMKYDIKKMMKILVYIYVISLGLACITRLINIGKDIQAIAIIGYVFSGLTYSAIVSILVNTFVHIIKVFITDFYKDESYLTHTLPVSKNKLLLSKYLSSLIVVLASVMVSLLSLIILLYSDGFVDGLKTLIEMAISNFNISTFTFVFLLTLVIFSQICSIMSMAFTAIVIGNKYNNKRVIKGLLWFGLFNFGSGMMTVLLATISFAITGNISELFANVLSQGAFITIIIIGLLAYIAYSIIFYFICNKLFNKGVNVD